MVGSAFAAISVHAAKSSVARMSSERNLIVSDVQPARQQGIRSGVPSNQASTITTTRLPTVAATGREDLVVLVNTSASAPFNPQPTPEIEVGTSPAHRFLDRDEETPQDERVCIQLWVLWAALTFPLVLSAWLLLVPFLIGKGTVASGRPVFPLPGTLSVPITTLNLTATTASPSRGVPPICLRPVVPPRLPYTYIIPPYPRGNVTAEHRQRPIFCFYDNAKVIQVGSGHAPPRLFNYMFESLPFALCPNVVYSSVGILNGELTSRMPDFDREHGLRQLRGITDNMGFPDTGILLALGGYPEDSPHFSRLGWDAAVMDNLMRSVVDGMQNYRLDGVTVNWVAPMPGCNGPDDMMVLALLLRRLRETYNTHGMSQFTISVILEIGVGNEHLVDSVADVVDYFFIGTNVLRYAGQGPYPDICNTFTRDAHQAIANYSRAAMRVRLDQLCLTEELAPWSILGFELPSGGWVEAPGSELRRAPFYIACRDTGFCRKDTVGASCIAHMAYAGPPSSAGRAAALFLVPSTDTLRLRVNFTWLPSSTGRPTSLHACVLVRDLHLDNYANQCGPEYMQYILMQHFYSGTLGRTRLGRSILDAAPLCQAP